MCSIDIPRTTSWRGPLGSKACHTLGQGFDLWTKSQQFEILRFKIIMWTKWPPHNVLVFFCSYSIYVDRFWLESFKFLSRFWVYVADKFHTWTYTGVELDLLQIVQGVFTKSSSSKGTQLYEINLPIWPLKGTLYGYWLPNFRNPCSQMHLSAHIWAILAKLSSHSCH